MNWNEIVNNYIVKYSNKIQATTRPLKECFGINYFTYHRIDKQGRYTVLLNRPDFSEYYVSEKLFLLDPYLRHPDQYQSGSCFLESYGSEDYHQVIDKAVRHFQMDLTYMQIKKQEDAVEFFGYSANRKSSSLENIYLNYPSLLTSFSTYFKKTMNSILRTMEEHAGSLVDLKGQDFFHKEKISPSIATETYLSYLNTIGLDRDVRLAASLSKREKECLHALALSRTAKDTAMQLNLSHRTIQFYLENIKNKLNCNSKQELFLTAQRFIELHLI